MELLERIFTIKNILGLLFIALAWNESDKYLQIGHIIIAFVFLTTNEILNEIRKLGK